MMKVVTKRALFFLLATSFILTSAYSAPDVYSPQECPVIGNTDSSIYHTAGQKFYARMLRKNKKGDNRRCFKSEEEARTAFFRRSKR